MNVQKSDSPTIDTLLYMLYSQYYLIMHNLVPEDKRAHKVHQTTYLKNYTMDASGLPDMSVHPSLASHADRFFPFLFVVRHHKEKRKKAV